MKIKRKWISLFLSAVLTVTLAGCGAPAGGAEGDEGAGNTAASGSGGWTQEEGGNAASRTAMGRYVEEEIDLSEQLSSPAAICRREDGSLVILGLSSGYLVSQDEGRTWEAELPDWWAKLKDDGYYISEADMAPDGTIGMLYDPVPDDEYKPVMLLVLPDGTQIPVELSLTEEDQYVRQIIMTQDNRFLVMTVCRNIYEINRDGSGELLFALRERPLFISVKENRMFMDDEDTVFLYDMEEGTYFEDETLSDFVEDNYGSRYYNGNYDCAMYMMPDDGQVVYLIGAKGIHRHVLDGNMMEQVVDGNLSLLSNPLYTITSAIRLEGDIFLVLFSNGRLLRFTYDPNVSAVPENLLTIYSLRESEDIRQAVSVYQSQNPDMFVSYEIGISEGSSVTRDDAIKKLNTEIMAGTGPDLIVMDDLPFASYVKKGMLLELTDYLEEYSAKEPLFDNVIDAMKIEGKAYVAPATISVPKLIGRQDILDGVKDLSDLGEALEALRMEHPEDNLIGICNEEGVMKRFMPASAPAWVSADGSIERETIREFIEQSKRIYDAQMDGIRTEFIQYSAEMNERYLSEYGHSIYQIDWPIYLDLFNYLGGEHYLVSGWVDTAYSYHECLSLEKTEGFGDCVMLPMQGHCKKVFQPKTMLGISAASGQTDAAKEFMGFFLSADAAEHYSGFSVNREAYERQFAVDEKHIGNDGIYGWISMSSQDGKSTAFAIYCPSEEQTAAFKEELASLSTAYIPDSVLEENVLTLGSAYIRGEVSLEDALDKIEKQVAIYMAE